MKSQHKTSIFKNGLYWLMVLTVCFSTISCKKFITIDAPPTNINEGNVFKSDATATAVLTGLYTLLSNENTNGMVGMGQGYNLMNIYPALCADELSLYDGVTASAYLAYYHNTITNNDIKGTDFWGGFYSNLYVVNTAINGLNASTSSLTPSIKTQLLGEAYFMRALFYFQLVNIYGDVPLVLSTDYEVNSKVVRTPKKDVYDQIIADLNNAVNMLSSQFLEANLTQITTERTRPNKYAAAALLARVYLYTGNYAGAETESSHVLDNSATYDLESINDAFLKNKRETIWALQSTGVGQSMNTGEGFLFVLPTTGPSNDYPLYLNINLVNSFDASDKRLQNWIGLIDLGTEKFYYPYKYKEGRFSSAASEYSIQLRVAEQFLIRAEARAQLGRLTGENSAASDLNRIRSRAGLGEVAATTKEDMLKAILIERRHELFTEWGHRWLDLKRTGTIDEVMQTATPAKGGPSWDTRQQLYPIPFDEMQKNGNLVQNPGYVN